MKQNVEVPSVGESVSKGLLTAWLKGQGDVVREGEAGFSLGAVARLLLDPAGGWHKRGLLVKARAHVVVASAQGSPEPSSRSFEVLLDYRLVRVFPPGSDEAVVYRVGDPAALRKLVENGRSPLPVA
mgnify:CR=1 FL=1